MKNNIIIGKDTGKNITTQSNCICIGDGADIDPNKGDGQVRIGKNCGKGADVVILGADENVWINRDIFEMILADANAILNNYGDKIVKTVDDIRVNE